jgi:hypothetical protein
MSLLKNLKTDETIANEKDSVGGGGPLESGLYKTKIAAAYVIKSTGGALGLVLNLTTDAGKQVRQTLWMTSKTGQNYYEKDGQKNYLPGFNMANSLALLTVGKEISDLDTEQKVIKAYSAEAKAEVPTKVDMLTDLLDKEVIVGLIKQTVDKTAKADDGSYQPTGETREENEIDKFFRAKDQMTTAEIRAQAEDAEFIRTWEKKWTGQVRNKAKGATGAGAAGAPKTGVPGSGKKPTTSLFG